VLALLMLNVLSGCNVWANNGTAIDRLKPDAAAHANALAGNDVTAMRETGLSLLSRLGAYANW
jgi:hypothetical protein